jgi:acyl-CoA synthetase (AMP-forming)/AMP-acid ligase II
MKGGSTTMQTLGHIFRRNAHLTPARPALIFEDRVITYAEQLDRSNRLASALWQVGTRPRDRVAILAMNCPEYVEVYGAAELAGFMIAAMNYRLAAPELAWILADADPRVLILEAQYAATIGGIRAKLDPGTLFVCIGEGCPDWAVPYERFVAEGAAEGAPSVARPEDPLTLMYTSGTTGRPKGVIRSNAADYNCAMGCAQDLNLAPGDRYLVMMPWFHIGARGQQMASAWRGATVVMHRRFDAAQVLADIERHRVTCTHMAPTLIHDCFEHPDIDRRDLSSLKTVYYAAAPMPLALLRRGLERLGNVFCNGYGSTEVTGLCLHKIDHVLEGPPELVERLKSIGQPQINADARIIDENWTSLPPRTVGEIALSGDGMMDGYWNNHAATAQALRDGWFRTGDMGYADEQGFIFLVDRKKDMIISGGENVYSREVEEALGSHQAVSEVAVIGVPDPRWGEIVRALVVAQPGHAAAEEDLIEHARALIARFKAPKSVVFVDSLIRLPSGKINKVALRELYGQSQDEA